VVNDGSSDATAEVVRPLPDRARGPADENPGNRGKGYSVRPDAAGAGRSGDVHRLRPVGAHRRGRAPVCRHRRGRGHRHRLALAGKRPPDPPPAALPPVLRPLLQRRHPRRHGLRFADTQCGFKAFTRAAAQTVFQLQTIERWGFDPEILFIALKRGYRVVEVPVSWAHDERTRMSYLKDGMKMLEEIAIIRWNALRGRYDKPVEGLRWRRSRPTPSQGSTTADGNASIPTVPCRAF
jgi:dolichyl-phosphate beta-glucosyltransferase